MEGCDGISSSYCIARIGTVVKGKLTFEVREEITRLDCKLYGDVGFGIFVDFPGGCPQPDGCQDLENSMTCPLSAGTTAVYDMSLFVDSNFPTVSLNSF